MPFYVSPEQMMRDRADYARKNIARGRDALVLQYDNGIALVAENLSGLLHKISEIYDRIAFVAVGRYHEFENLRMAGIRVADMQGYAFDRRDVTGRMLANTYAQVLGTIFSSGAEKPYEVELFVCEVGDSPETDQIYRLTYDGSVADEHGFAVMGGSAEQVSAYVKERYRENMPLADVLRLAVDALGHDTNPPRKLTARQLEVAVLDRTRTQERKFRRLRGTTLDRLLESTEPADESSAPGESTESTGSESTADGNGPTAGTGDGGANGRTSTNGDTNNGESG